MRSRAISESTVSRLTAAAGLIGMGDDAEVIRQMAGLATPMSLRVGVTLGLPDRLLGNGTRVAQLASELEVSPIALEVRLGHLATLGMVERTATGYRTTDFGAN